MKRNSTIVLGLLAAVVIAAVLTAWAVREFAGGSETDRAMAAMRAQPLVGLVLADNPAMEAELRSAVEEDQRHPQAGPSRAFLVIGRFRKTIIGPTVSAADDATALAVMKARAELVVYLQKSDLVACRQFAGEGIHDISKLDSEGQRLFRATLAAMEAAYRNGKANGGKGTPPSNQEFAGLLQSAGFTADDFAKLSQVATLKDADYCALELRVDDAPSTLPDDKRGAFARFVIAH
jgi:hypothetical protein